GAAGERVLLLHQSSLDYMAGFFGCLCAGAIAVPAYPPRAGRSDARLEAIASDATPAYAIGPASLATESGIPGLPGVTLLTADELPAGLEDGWRRPAVTDDTIVFLQYTSGSTSSPRGVVVSHGNLLHNLVVVRDRLAIGSDH